MSLQNGYYKMGVNFPEFRVATNQNDVLHRLFSTGDIRLVRCVQVWPIHGHSVASDFERLLYFILNKDAHEVRKVMETFVGRVSIALKSFLAMAFQVRVRGHGNTCTYQKCLLNPIIWLIHIPLCLQGFGPHPAFYDLGHGSSGKV